MKYEIDQNRERMILDGFAFPLGWEPTIQERPYEGYMITFCPGDGELPDAHQFLIMVSHEKLQAVMQRLFSLLPEEVVPILEAGSRDAYRQIDVLMSDGLIPKTTFLAVWNHFEAVLMEDGAIAAGAMSEEPYFEVFLSEFKTITVNLPASESPEFEAILQTEFSLDEVADHWPNQDEIELPDAPGELRTVLVQSPHHLSVDDIIVHLQRAWHLELNIDLDQNLDEQGRNLGVTLWHIIILAQHIEHEEHMAFIEIWLSADSLGRAEDLVADVLDEMEQWDLDTMVAQDRVPYDDRPPELDDLELCSTATGVWLTSVQDLT